MRSGEFNVSLVSSLYFLISDATKTIKSLKDYSRVTLIDCDAIFVKNEITRSSLSRIVIDGL